MLAGIMVVNVHHLSADIGYLMAAIIIGSVTAGYSAIFSIVTGSNDPKRWLVLIAILPLLYGDWHSIKSSERAFAKAKHQQMIDERAGPMAGVNQNMVIIANNRMVDLASRGITSGPEFDAAQQQVQQAQSDYRANIENGHQSSSELAMTGGDSEADINAMVQATSYGLSWLLELLMIALSIICGVSALIAGAFGMGYMTPTKATKKPNGHRQTKTKKAVQLVDLVDELAPRDTAGTKDKPVERLAREVQAHIKAGTLVDGRDQKPITKTISNRALVAFSTSSDTRKAILAKLEKWGDVTIGKNGQASIADPVTGDIVSALENLGHNKKSAEWLATKANGETFDDRLRHALKLSA